MKEKVDLLQIADVALKEATKLRCSDVSIIPVRTNSSQVRFSNNVITLVNNVRNVTLDVYIAKEKKRIVGSSSNPTEEGIRHFIQNLVKSCETLLPSEEYVPLPSGPFHYSKNGNFDPKVQDADIVDYVGEVIESALRAGAMRVSGSINTESSEIAILTSAGVSGRDTQSMMLLNARAFASDNASGHGLSCASFLSEFKPVEAGERAGSHAKMALNPKQIEEGKYDVIFTGTVAANIWPLASAASAFSIKSGVSFLTDKLGQSIAVESLGITDVGVPANGLGGRGFDDEGSPTQDNKIVEGGIFKTILHNTSTGRQFNAKSTGSAGILAPHAHTIVFNGGDSSLEEMIKETMDGIYITNNWYTRYQNQRTGEYSTVPRDAAFRIRSGELAESLYGLRISDSIPRQLSNISSISRSREWIKWWEVQTPTFAPIVKVSDVGVTRAVGS